MGQGGNVIAMGAIAGAAVLALGWALWLARRLRAERDHAARLADRLDALPTSANDAAPGAGLDRLGAAFDRVAAQVAAVDHRLGNRHVLTGLPTREPLLAAIAGDAAAAETGGLLGTVALLDVERLAAFDAALAERFVVTLVERVMRMVAGRRMVAQVDRARLAIWFGAGLTPDAARAELDAIGYALGGAVVDGEREILPEIRIGSARFPHDGATPQALLTRAIAALTLDAATVADAASDPVAIARDRYAVEQDLRQAVARGELELRFQPLIDAAGPRVCGAEALLRWLHPTRGMVPPTRFIPIMEAAGLAEEIGLWTLNAAVREARGWQQAGFEGLRVAVNVSGHQLDRDGFSLLVGRTLARHALAPDKLEVELTETVAAGDVARAARIFDALRLLGVRIAIDDFGTGFSSLSTLRHLRFDKLKIDREFVTDVDTRRDSQAICQSIIALARGLGIRVLAEGVERVEEYEWLLAHGCSHFQGYYFSVPLTAEGFAAFVRDRAGLRRLVAAGPDAQRRRLVERLRA